MQNTGFILNRIDYLIRNFTAFFTQVFEAMGYYDTQSLREYGSIPLHSNWYTKRNRLWKISFYYVTFELCLKYILDK